MNKFYRVVSIFLIFLLIVSSNLFVFANSELESPNVIFSEEDYNNMTVIDKQIYTEEVVNSVENYLEELDTDVVTQLEIAKKELEDMLEVEINIEERLKLEDLIDSYDLAKNDYLNYKLGVQNNLSSEPSISLYAANIPAYKAAVASIITYFNVNGYHLASELLSHAAYRSSGGSYSPRFGNKVNDSENFRKLKASIRRSGSMSGSGSSSFPPGDNKDLYYAIHLYNYSYSRNMMVITDFYDFALNDKTSGLAGTAINMCYFAQQAGVLVPFTTLIRVHI